MVRPKRMYKTNKKGKTRYYYVIGGKRKYIKVPKNISQKQVVKINIKNVLSEGRRIKRRKKKVIPKYEKPVVKEGMTKALISSTGLPVYFFEPGKQIINVAEERQKRLDIKDEGSEELKKVKLTLQDIQTKGNELSNITKRLISNDILNENRIMMLFENMVPQRFNAEEVMPDLEEEDVIDATPTIAPETPLTTATNQLKSLERVKKTIADITERLSRTATPIATPLREEEEDLLSSPEGPTLAEIAKQNEEQIRRDREASIAEAKKARVGAEESKGEEDVRGQSQILDYQVKIETLLRRPLTKNEAEVFTGKNAVGTDIPFIKKMIQELKEKNNIKYRKTIVSRKGLREFIDELYSQRGKGSSLKEGLYNDEVETLLKKRIKDFVPVIPSDKSEEMLGYVKPNMKRFGFIINTNPSTSDGSGTDGYQEGHWRSVFFNNEDDFTSAEYFDPLAKGNPEVSLINSMKKIAKKMNPEKYFLLKVNNLKRQSDGTATCGWHSVKFLDDRFQGIPWEEATGYKYYMEKNKPTDSSNGEKEIKKYFEKYKSYI